MDSPKESNNDTTLDKKEPQDNASNKSEKSNKSKKSDKSQKSDKLEKSDKSQKSHISQKSNKSEKEFPQDVNVENFDINEDKEKKFNNFLQYSSNEYSAEEMKKFLKYGITSNGVRMMTTDTCSWFYDYYKITKTSPELKEFTDNTTVDYYYYTTPFSTQLGNINLVMMHSQVNFEDGTNTPSDRFYKMNAVTPDMIKNAKIKAEQIKKSSYIKSL